MRYKYSTAKQTLIKNNDYDQAQAFQPLSFEKKMLSVYTVCTWNK
jgi:hypothetical protein